MESQISEKTCESSQENRTIRGPLRREAPQPTAVGRRPVKISRALVHSNWWSPLALPCSEPAEGRRKPAGNLRLYGSQGGSAGGIAGDVGLGLGDKLTVGSASGRVQTCGEV